MFKTFLFSLMLGTSFASNATLIEFDNGDNPISISAYTGEQSAFDNWNQNLNPDIGPAGDSKTLKIFFYENPTDGLTINFLLSKQNSEETSGSLSLTTRILSEGDPTILHSDDSYAEFHKGDEPGVFEGQWAWVDCCTDGAVIGGLTGDWGVDIDIHAFNNVENFMIVSGDGSTFNFSPTETFSLGSESFDFGQLYSLRDVPTPLAGFCLLPVFMMGLRRTPQV